jgi:outer membrane protein TolC
MFQLTVALAVWLFCSGVAGAQDRTGGAAAGLRRITLQQAQQLAATAVNPLVRLGQLQVEAAEQHRLGVKSMYFPSVDTQLENLHLNTAPGEVLTVPRPLRGTTLSVPVNIFEQDQTSVNVSVVQPITPIFAVRQLVKIARADENIARAKAGMPVAEQVSLVEKNYFDLLIAQRELVSAGAEARTVRVTDMADTIGAARSWLLAESTVKELTASLDEMLGLPAGTRLEPVPPEPLVEDLSLADAVTNATAGSADVIEAEQTAAKARAGSTLAKMEYFPSIGIIGGYTHQRLISNTVLPHDFAYVGFMLTYTLFDSGKRERGVKEGNAQAKMAELAAELTKAKVASAVRSSYLELERSRELYQLTRRMVAPTGVVLATYVSDGQEMDPSQAKLEAELFRAELEYRQAYARVKSLMVGSRMP